MVLIFIDSCKSFSYSCWAQAADRRARTGKEARLDMRDWTRRQLVVGAAAFGLMLSLAAPSPLRAEGEALLEARDVRGLPPVPRRTRAVLGTGAAVLVEDAPADRVLLRRRLEVPGKRTLGALQGGFAKGRLRARLKARLRARRGHVQGRGHGEGMARRGASCQAAQTRAGVRGRGRAIGLGLGLRLGALPLVRVVAGARVSVHEVAQQDARGG